VKLNTAFLCRIYFSFSLLFHFLFINNLLRRRFKILRKSSFYITMSISFHFSSCMATHFISYLATQTHFYGSFTDLINKKRISEKRKEPFPVLSTVNKSINFRRIIHKFWSCFFMSPMHACRKNSVYDDFEFKFMSINWSKWESQQSIEKRIRNA